MIERIRTNEDRRVVRVQLTSAGNDLVTKAPQVAQGLIVAGLEELPQQKLGEISLALEALVCILGAQEMPPQLMLAPEMNKVPPRRKGPAKRNIHA